MSYVEISMIKVGRHTWYKLKPEPFYFKHLFNALNMLSANAVGIFDVLGNHE